jgi:hypothetical protein
MLLAVFDTSVASPLPEAYMKLLDNVVSPRLHETVAMYGESVSLTGF